MPESIRATVHRSLPELTYPFPSAVSPYADLVQSATAAWLTRVQIFPPRTAATWVDRSKVGWLAARFHPSAPCEVLELIGAWYAWGLLWDDLCDETELGATPALMSKINARSLDILRGQPLATHDHAMTAALADIYVRLSRHATPIWLRRFSRSVRDYLDATVWEASNRQQGTIPELATYLRMRLHTSALHTDTDLIELAEGTRLPPEVRDHAVVQRLTAASNNVVCWANDILSLAKELDHGDRHNLVVILQHTYALPWEAALTRAAEMHDAEVQTFVVLETILPRYTSTLDRNLRGYVDVLRARMRGGLDWAYDSGRYGDATP